jgi:DNA-binding NtrC family response regulator
VLRLARARFPDLQVVLMTGFPTLAAQEEALRLGAVEWVTKPFGVLEVLAICDGAIQTARRRQADRKARQRPS